MSKSRLLNCWPLSLVFKRYHSTYDVMPGSCYICRNIIIFKYLTLKVESQPLKQMTKEE